MHPGHIGTNILTAAKVNRAEGEARHWDCWGGLTPPMRSRVRRFEKICTPVAAKVILDGVRKQRSRIFIGMDAKLIDLVAVNAYALRQTSADFFAASAFKK